MTDAAFLLRTAGVDLCWSDPALDSRGCVVRPDELTRETAMYLDGDSLVRVPLDGREVFALVAYLLGLWLDTQPAPPDWITRPPTGELGTPDCEAMRRERLASATCDLWAPDIDPERPQDWRGEMGLFPTRYWIAKRPHSSVDFAGMGVRL